MEVNWGALDNEKHFKTCISYLQWILNPFPGFPSYFPHLRKDLNDSRRQLTHCQPPAFLHLDLSKLLIKNVLLRIKLAVHHPTMICLPSSGGKGYVCLGIPYTSWGQHALPEPICNKGSDSMFDVWPLTPVKPHPPLPLVPHTWTRWKKSCRLPL